MRPKRFLIAGVLTIVLGLAVVPSAFATSTSVAGNLNRDGTLVQYGTVRAHTFTGPINIYLSNNTVNYTRLGLRDGDTGVQFTYTHQWDSAGSGHDFVMTSNNSITMPVGRRFAINGRMGSTKWPLDNHWEGTLSY